MSKNYDTDVTAEYAREQSATWTGYVTWRCTNGPHQVRIFCDGVDLSVDDAERVERQEAENRRRQDEEQEAARLQEAESRYPAAWRDDES